jgi:hypothetical protein
MAILDGIVGHDIPKQFFRNFLSDPGTMPHALLLTGPPGVGKFALAFEFARAFNCLERGGDKCACRHCRQVGLGTFSDIFIASPESEVKAEHIRRLIGEAVITPRVSSRRLVILDNFDRVNETGANIFLKTLEEPPEHLVFLLCTAKPDALLPTILSRCIPIELRPGHPLEIAKVVKSLFPESHPALIERTSATGCFGAAARELYAEYLSSNAAVNTGEGEPYGLLIQAFIDGLLKARTGDFAYHLKGPFQTLLGSVETRWGLRQMLPKGLDIAGLRKFLDGQYGDFNPVNYLTDELGRGGKLGEYDKGRILLGDLTRELYSRLLKARSDNGDTGDIGEKILLYLDVIRHIGYDLNGNRNIELSFEKLLVSVEIPK